MATRVQWLGHACLLFESDGTHVLVDPFLTGFHITFKDGTKVYDAADTGLFGDMRLIGEEGIDLAILPIGDNYTMGPDDALRAVQMIQPKKVLPIHYNTFDLIAQDAAAWAERVRRETKTEPVVLKPGETME